MFEVRKLPIQTVAKAQPSPESSIRKEAIKPGALDQETPEQVIPHGSQGRCVLTVPQVKTIAPYRGTVTLKRWPLLFHYLGLQGHILNVTKFDRRCIRISFRIVVPGTTKTITLDVDAQLASNKWSISPTIMLDRTIPDGSEIISACARGDLDRTRNLFVLGKASVLDVTQNNTTLLYVSSDTRFVYSYIHLTDKPSMLSIVEMPISSNSSCPREQSQTKPLG